MSAAKNNSFGEVGLHPMGGPLLALVRTPHSVRLLAALVVAALRSTSGKVATKNTRATSRS